MSAPSPTAETTLLVLLGASRFPKAGLDPKDPAEVELVATAFAETAGEVSGYFKSLLGFGLPEENLLPLFETEEGADEIDHSIQRFVAERVAAATPERRPRDLIIYYVGHGLFDDKRMYCLALRRTRVENVGVSSIRVADLASSLGGNAAEMRVYLILDACFSAEATKEFLSKNPTDALIQQVENADRLPQKGISLFSSSASTSVSRLVLDRKRTMFSESLLHVLWKGNGDENEERLSFKDVQTATEAILRWKNPENAVRPELHSPRQLEGDIARIPFFPNNVSTVRENRLRKEEELRLERERKEEELRLERERQEAEERREREALAEQRRLAEVERLRAESEARLERERREAAETEQRRLVEVERERQETERRQAAEALAEQQRLAVVEQQRREDVEAEGIHDRPLDRSLLLSWLKRKASATVSASTPSSGSSKRALKSDATGPCTSLQQADKFNSVLTRVAKSHLVGQPISFATAAEQHCAECRNAKQESAITLRRAAQRETAIGIVVLALLTIVTGAYTVSLGLLLNALGQTDFESGGTEVAPAWLLRVHIVVVTIVNVTLGIAAAICGVIFVVQQITEKGGDGIGVSMGVGFVAVGLFLLWVVGWFLWAWGWAVLLEGRVNEKPSGEITFCFVPTLLGAFGVTIACVNGCGNEVRDLVQLRQNDSSKPNSK